MDVGVYFEKVNINTLEGNRKMMLIILISLSQ